MSFLDRIFGDRRERAALQPLYDRIVALARDPFWYREGQVPDTIDGRFDMVSSILAFVLLRLEGEDGAARRSEVLLTEVFIDDMDGTVRQLGIGDQVVGKHVGKMMSALGGRLGAYRDAGGDGGGDGGGDAAALEDAVRRNIFRDQPPSDEAVTAVAARLAAFRRALQGVTLPGLLAARLPRP